MSKPRVFLLLSFPLSFPQYPCLSSPLQWQSGNVWPFILTAGGRCWEIQELVLELRDPAFLVSCVSGVWPARCRWVKSQPPYHPPPHFSSFLSQFDTTSITLVSVSWKRHCYRNLHFWLVLQQKIVIFRSRNQFFSPRSVLQANLSNKIILCLLIVILSDLLHLLPLEVYSRFSLTDTQSWSLPFFAPFSWCPVRRNCPS